MLSRSLLRAASAPVVRRPQQQHLRAFASEANKATSSPKGTHGGHLPNSGDPRGKTTAYYAYYGAVALGLCGAGYYFLSGPGKPADKRR